MKRPLLAVCLAIACVIALGYWFYPPPLQDRVPAGAEEIIIYGRVDRKENRVSYGKEQLILYLSDYLLYSSDSWPDLHLLQAKSTNQEENQIMCYIPCEDLQWEEGSYREPKMGAFVLVQGKPQEFHRATNPGAFDSRLYYATLGIDFSVKKGKVLWEGDSYNIYREVLWKLRCHWQERLDKVLPADEAAVTKTMLLGERGTLDSELKSLYQDGGIAHILAISGLHISMIGMGLYKLLRRVGIPVWCSALMSGVFIYSYGVMTGEGVSAGRAVGMFLVRMLAEILGRGYDMLTALGLLLLCMLCRQPLYAYHSGFLLSFLALFGIGFLRPALEKGKWEKRGTGRYREGWKKWLHTMAIGVRENFLTGLSVTLVTLPVTFLFFYEIPVYSVFLNLLVLPLMPAVMYMGMGLLFLPEGPWLQLPSVLLTIVLDVVEWLCRQSLDIPGQMLVRGKPESWQIVVYVLLLVGTVLGKRWKFPRRGRVAMLCVAVFILCMKCPGGGQITFLDVGQGDCICIQTAEGNTYLVDCGSSSENSVGKYVVAPFLKSEGISHLEAVIVTHPDEDHCNGLAGMLIEGYAGKIGVLLLPDIPPESKSEEYFELENLALAHGIPIGYLSAGMWWQDGEMRFTCLHPGKNCVGAGEEPDSNEYSVVLHIESGNFSALLTGDVEGEGEERLREMLMAAGIDKVTVLKVAHHGSRYSTTKDFLGALDAEVAIISCGADNSYGHPHPELIRRLLDENMLILSTSEYGAVEIEYGAGDEISVQYFGE